ncbi:MAG: DUF2807 domain-containing protein [Dehalococcoidia bacterium]|jgi:hypothetical protein
MAKKKNFSGYTRVRVKTTVDVEITGSDSFNIDVETGPLSPIKMRQKGDTLTISRPWCWFVFGFFFRLSRAHVRIGIPQLLELEVSDNSSAGVAGFSSSDEFKLTLSGTSSFGGDLKTGDARLDISGSSQAEFTGSSSNLFLKVKDSSSFAANINVAGNAEIEVSANSAIALAGSAGSILADISNVSNADMSGFSARDINIKLNRLSNVTIKLDGKLDADVTGASELRWSGNPVMGTIKVTTGSVFQQE